MKWNLSIPAAVVLAAALVVGTPLGPASAAPSESLTVEPGFTCVYPEYSGPCVTEFTTKAWASEDGLLDARFKVTNLDTGATQWLAAYVTIGETSGETSRAELAAGRYQVDLTFETLGHWSCSQYNPDGCSWIEGGTERHRWAFVYAPGKTVKVRELVPASTKATKVRFKSAGKGKARLTGVIVGRALRADFSLAPQKRLSGRVVRYEEKRRGKWRLITKARTKANGSFATRPVSTDTGAIKGRIVVLAKGKYPGATSVFYLY